MWCVSVHQGYETTEATHGAGLGERQTHAYYTLYTYAQSDIQAQTHMHARIHPCGCTQAIINYTTLLCRYNNNHQFITNNYYIILPLSVIAVDLHLVAVFPSVKQYWCNVKLPRCTQCAWGKSIIILLYVFFLFQEQLIFCYQTLADYLDTFDRYANFK